MSEICLDDDASITINAVAAVVPVPKANKAAVEPDQNSGVNYVLSILVKIESKHARALSRQQPKQTEGRKQLSLSSLPRYMWRECVFHRASGGRET